MSNSAVTKKVKILGVIIVLIIGCIIAFQVSWVTQTYERSKKAIKGNLQGDLEMMVGLYEQEIADSVRKLLKEIIQINPSFNYRIFDDPMGRSIGYRYENGAYVRFKINSSKGIYNKNEAYQVLQNELNSAPIAELRAIYFSLISPQVFYRFCAGRFRKSINRTE